MMLPLGIRYINDLGLKTQNINRLRAKGGNKTKKKGQWSYFIIKNEG